MADIRTFGGAGREPGHRGGVQRRHPPAGERRDHRRQAESLRAGAGGETAGGESTLAGGLRLLRRERYGRGGNGTAGQRAGTGTVPGLFGQWRRQPLLRYRLPGHQPSARLVLRGAEGGRGKGGAETAGGGADRQTGRKGTAGGRNRRSGGADGEELRACRQVHGTERAGRRSRAGARHRTGRQRFGTARRGGAGGTGADGIGAATAPERCGVHAAAQPAEELRLQHGGRQRVRYGEEHDTGVHPRGSDDYGRTDGEAPAARTAASGKPCDSAEHARCGYGKGTGGTAGYRGVVRRIPGELAARGAGGV